MDELRDYYTKWSQAEKNQSHIMYMRNLKNNTNQSIHKTNRLTDIEDKRTVTKGEREGELHEGCGKIDTNDYTQWDKQQGFTA